MFYKGLQLQVVHLHPSNSTAEQRKFRTYRTLCIVRDPNKQELVTVDSICSPNDAPRRKRGFEIAVGRAKKFVDGYINESQEG